MKLIYLVSFTLQSLAYGNIFVDTKNASPHQHECGIQVGERDDHPTLHRRMVSVQLPESCIDSNVIEVDIPHDGNRRAFRKKRITRTKNKSTGSSSSPVTEYTYWEGMDETDGSTFAFVQDVDKVGLHITGSMVEISSGNVFQFRNENGSHFVTITHTNDFPPEGDPEDDPEHEDSVRKLLTGTHKEEVNDSRSSDNERGLAVTPRVIPSLRERLEVNGVVQPVSTKRELLDDNGGNLDILVVWTAKAECRASGFAAGCTLTSSTENAIRSTINLAVSETNSGYTTSGVQTTLHLAHAYRHPTYVESSFGTTLSDARLNSIPGLHDARTQYGADLVAVIIDDPQYCGLAYVGPSIGYMYSVTAWNCATGYYSFGHEIGHNMGCLHDRGTEGACSSSNYNYGYRDPSADFRTVLAYSCASGQCDNNAGGGCTRVNVYSNPNTSYLGKAVGSAVADNVRQINENRVEVAGYYTHVSNNPPTATPTVSPVTSAPVVSPTATSAPVGLPSLCVNSPLRLRVWFNGRYRWKDCNWIANNPGNRCKKDGMKAMCPVACGTCNTCADTTARFKVVINGVKRARDCSWANNYRCSLFQGLDQTCRLTCGTCIGSI